MSHLSDDLLLELWAPSVAVWIGYNLNINEYYCVVCSDKF